MFIYGGRRTLVTQLRPVWRLGFCYSAPTMGQALEVPVDFLVEVPVDLSEKGSKPRLDDWILVKGFLCKLPYWGSISK